jgi:hypothetical protein
MTAEEFRSLALSLPEATEQSHMDHPDFRVRGRIFATLGYPDSGRAMVKLIQEERRRSLAPGPRCSRRCPAAGAGAVPPT